MKWKARLRKWVIALFFPNSRMFEAVRFELEGVWQDIKNALNPVYWWRRACLTRKKHLLVSFGAGERKLDGWINTDIRSKFKHVYITVDIRKKLPFLSNQVKFAYAEHVLEHIDFQDNVPLALAEMYRVLEPGGVVRIVVPDAALFIEAYLSRDPKKWKETGWDIEFLPPGIYTPMHAINHVFHQEGEHLFGYDFETLEFVLKRAGFQKIIRQKYQQSLMPEHCLDMELHSKYSLYVEAVKP